MATASNRTVKGSYLLILTAMWEYFSYYGMRALLVLYLTQGLLFTDKHAYALYGAYTTMIYVMPLVGGWIADRYLGYRWSVFLGGALIALGHFMLWLHYNPMLFIGLATIVMGVGFFKGNAICLVGKCYDHNPSGRAVAFSLYYVGGNIGATLAPILTAYAAQRYGWHMGFALAGIGMTMGLLVMLLGWRLYRDIGNPSPVILTPKGYINWRASMLLVVGLGVVAVVVMGVLLEDWAGWVILVVGAAALVLLAQVYLTLDKRNRNAMWVIFAVSLASIVFWAFDQQGGSSISLFIQRNVSRLINFHIGHWHFHQVIPTAMFQSVNPLVILIFGPLVALVWKVLAKYQIRLTTVIRFAIGFVFLTGGFFLIASGAFYAEGTGKASMVWVVVGLMLIGTAEMFIDPMALALISNVSPKQSVGLLTGIYYLFSGAFANYAAAALATTSDVAHAPHQKVNDMIAAQSYHHLYLMVTMIGIGLAVALVLVNIFLRRWELALYTKPA